MSSSETARDCEVHSRACGGTRRGRRLLAKECEHGGHDGVGAAVALVAVGDGDTVFTMFCMLRPYSGSTSCLSWLVYVSILCFYPVRRLKDTPKIPNRQTALTTVANKGTLL